MKLSKTMKKFIAIVSAIAMVVSSLTVYNAKAVNAAEEGWINTEDAEIQWLHRQADGSLIVEDGNAYYDVEGITGVYAGSWAQAALEASTTETDLYSLPINVTKAGNGSGWSMQVSFKAAGLDTAKVYSIKLLAGEKVIFETSESGVAEYKNTVDVTGKLEQGKTTLKLDVTELIDEGGVVEVKDITITPNEEKIAETRKIWADWVNPEGTAKAYAYLEEVDSSKDAATEELAWIFNQSAGQPMNAVDNVATTRDQSIKVEAGKTYKFIVEAVNAFGKRVGYGEKDITIPELSDEEKAYEEAAKAAEAKLKANYNSEANLALKKTVFVGSKAEEAKIITDGDLGTRWQATASEENTTFGVDLGAVYNLTDVIVSWEASNAMAYEIYVAGADEVYGETPVTTVSGLKNNQNIVVDSALNNVKAQYIKIVVTEHSANAKQYGICAYELVALGSADGETESESVSETESQTPVVIDPAPAGLPDDYTAFNGNEDFGYKLVNVAEGTNVINTVDQGENLYIAFNAVPGFLPDYTGATLNGGDITVAAGTGVTLAKASLTKKVNVLVVTDTQGNENTINIYNVNGIEDETESETESESVSETESESESESTPVVTDEPIEVVGASIQSQDGAKVTFTWGQNDNQIALGQVYNVYIDGELYQKGVAPQAITYEFAAAGKHVIKITAVLGDKETEGVTLDVTVEGEDDSSETESETESESESVSETESQTPVVTGKTLGFDTENSYLDSTGWVNAKATLEAEGGNATVNISSTGDNQGDNSMWGLQVKSIEKEVIPGEKYTYTATIVSDTDKEVFVKVADKTTGDPNNEPELASQRVQLKAGVPQDITLEFTPDVDLIQVVYALGTMGAEATKTNLVVTISDSKLAGKDPSDVETDPETESETESQTPVVTDPTGSSVETTTAKVDNTTTTAKADNTTTTSKVKVNAPGKTVVKKVYAKKKAAKKVKLTLKKVKGAKGYQVAIYKTKKNAKKNKKALVKKFVKKTKKVTIKNKKLKNKSKLFVRARAYVLDGKKKVYGKWSTKIKKIKIKK